MAVFCCSAPEERAREVRDDLIRLNALYLELTCPIQVSHLGESERVTGWHKSIYAPEGRVSRGTYLDSLWPQAAKARWYSQSDSSSFEGVKPSSSVNRTGDVKGRQAMSWFVVARS
jgi:hypothetical protein